MLALNINVMGWSIGFLFLLSAQSILAQSNEDSTFDAIDFYSGKIVPGFGGGFDQTSYDDSNGRQRFITTPSLYGSVGQNWGIQISHKTEWPKDKVLTITRADSALTIVQRLEPVRTKTSFMELQWQPAPALRFFASGALSRTDLTQNQIIERTGIFTSTYAAKIENRNEQFRLSGLYLSNNGKLTLKPAQVGWIYYGNTTIPFLPSLFVTPIRFLQKGQTMASFAADMTNLHEDGVTVQQDNNRKSDQRRKIENRTLPLNLDLLYGLNDNLMLGLGVEASEEIHDVEDKAAFTDPFLSRMVAHRASIEAKQFRFGPHVDFLRSEKDLHRLTFDYKRLQQELNHLSTSLDSVVINSGQLNVDKSWSFGYAFHRFWNVPPPSLPAYLADWNNDFGNRLPAGGFHLKGEIFFGGGKRDIELMNLTDQSHTERESRSLAAHLSASVGISNWLEFAWKTQIERSWREVLLIKRSGSSFTEINSGINNITWLNAIIVNFANYRYTERLRTRFGWYEMSAFDQLYGPLLLPGMLNAMVAYQPNQAFAEGWFSDHPDYLDFRFPDQWREETWSVETDLRVGLVGNLQVSATSMFSGNSRKSQATFAENGIAATISWQPWPSVRLALTHHFETDDKDFDEQDKFWNLQVQTLF